MALAAIHFCVQVLERIFRRSMFFHSVYGGLPIIYRVARRALAFVRARGELPVMLVFVAIHAFAERYLRLEIVALVAIAASHRHVLSEQREFRFLVVETHELRNFLPTGGHVAALAGRSEAALVRIGVAPGAFREREPRVLRIRLGVLDNGVALHAINLLVCPGEGIFRGGMIEF